MQCSSRKRQDQFAACIHPNMNTWDPGTQSFFSQFGSVWAVVALHKPSSDQVHGLSVWIKTGNIPRLDDVLAALSNANLLPYEAFNRT